MVHIVTVVVEAEAALRQIVDVVDLVDGSDSDNDNADTDKMASTTGGDMLEKTPPTSTKILVTSVPTNETPTHAGEKATEPVSARVIPEYPHKTKKLKPPHPDWRVMLPRPRCINNDEGDLEWVSCYFLNKHTGKVTWTPPPPPGIAENEDDAMDVEPILASKQNLSSMKSFVITPPPAEAYARE